MSAKRSSSTSPVAIKKARTESNPNTPKDPKDGGPKELSKGAKWMIAQIDRMQGHHTACLKAVTAIIQYRTYAKQLRTRNPQIPPALLQRLQSHWEAYECIRRHVEWYITQNALHASTPSRPPPPTTSPLASTVTPLTSILTQDLQKASPVPLSSSIMAYDTQTDPTSSIAPMSGNSGLPGSGIPSVPGPKPITAFTSSDPLNLAGEAQLDLSSLGVDELSAFLSGSNDASLFGDSTGDEFIAGLFSEPSAADVNQTETDRLLASLVQPPGQGSAGGEGDFIFDFGATDGGEMDMTQLVGLFEDNDQTKAAAPPPLLQGTTQANSAPTVPPAEKTQPAPAPTVNKAGEQATPETAAGHKKRPSIGVGVGSTPANSSGTPQTNPSKTPIVEPAPTAQVPAPAAQSALDQAMASIGDGQYDLSNIDLDDFNFGDGSMPNVEGDEFESLFAEFK